MFQFIHRRWLTVLLLMLLSLIGYISYSISVSQRIVDLEKNLNSSTQHVVHLHEKIGYGGLIHNFKNYLIRGDEKYLKLAKKDAAEAMAEVNELEAHASAIGVSSLLVQTREMVNSYNQNLDLIENAYSLNEDPLQIDIRVAVDDSKALVEINNLLTEVRDAIASDLSDLRKVNQFQGRAMVVWVMLVFFFLVWSNKVTRHRSDLRASNRTLMRSLEDSERANQALSEFAGIASHDLRSPIRHVRLYSDMISEDRGNPEVVAEHAASILKATERMDCLVQSLLQFAKTSNREPQLEKVESEKLVKEVLQAMTQLISETGTRVRLKALPTILADRELLRITFTNLIENAVKYRKADMPAVIEIGAKKDVDRWVFSVSDNGIGIESQYAEKIFRPLQRLHGEKSGYKGVGIGLALVKSIIDSHQGKIWLDPDYSLGSKFYFTL